jgi:hypothetical protein
MKRSADENKMAAIEYKIITYKDCPDLPDISDEVVISSWPEFMRKDPIANKYWPGLYQTFPEFQFALLAPLEVSSESIKCYSTSNKTSSRLLTGLETGTNNAIAVGNSIPLTWDGNPEDLPDDGWDWALAQGFRDYSAGRTPNIQCALSITIPQKYRGKGISAYALKAMKSIGERHGFDVMIAPVRPTFKSRYPLVPMERYIQWKNDDGLPFDPWIRVHVRLGAEVVKVCPQSMRITGTIEDWELWTGMRFPESGTYIVPGALVPVEIDRDANQGTYVEPNVWLYHNNGPLDGL